jgi:hypothetical protein
MIKSGDGAGLALKTLVEPLEANLDSDITAQARVVRPIDLSHATLANGCKDFVGAEPITLRERHVRESAKFTPLPRDVVLQRSAGLALSARCYRRLGSRILRDCGGMEMLRP